MNVIDPLSGKVTKSAKIGALSSPRIMDLEEYVVLITNRFNNDNDLICIKSSNLKVVFKTTLLGYPSYVFLDKQKNILALSIENHSENGSRTSNYILGLSLTEKVTQKPLGSQVWYLSASDLNFKPVITENFVFTIIGSKLYCINKTDGLTRWEFDSGAYLETPPLANLDNIIISKGKKAIVCLSQKIGETKWIYNNEKGVKTEQLLISGLLLVKEGEYDLNLLDPNTGKLISQLTRLYWHKLFVDQNKICSYHAGNVTFIDIETKTTSQPWVLPPVERILDDFANLDVNVWGFWQGKLLISILDLDRYRQDLECYDANTLKKIWSMRINKQDSRDSIQVLDGKILILNENFLSLLDMENGKEIWQKTLNTPNPEHISMNPDYVYVKDQDKAICFSTETGKTMWEYGDKKVTTQTGSYQDEMVLCSFGSMTFLKGNLPIKQPLTNKNWQQANLVFGSIILLGLSLIVANIIISRKKQKPNNQSQEGQAS